MTISSYQQKKHACTQNKKTKTKNAQLHKVLQFFSTSFHILNHYKPSIFPKN